MNASRYATPPFRRLGLLVTAWVLCAPAAAPALADADPLLLLQAQRAAFRDAWPHAERGQWAPVEPSLPLLEDYVLYPELRGAWLRATVAQRSRDELFAYLDRYPEHPSGRELMLRWLAVLASREDWPGYLEVYHRLGGSDSARLRCLAARAELATGLTTGWHERALALWRVGISQPDACDPVFAQLRRDGELDEATVRERLALAIEARQFQLARFLARSLPARDLQVVERWEAMQQDPAARLAGYPEVPGSAAEWARVRYGLLVLAARDATLAFAHWQRLAPQYPAADAEADEVARRIALAGARRNRPQADTLLAALPGSAVDLEVRHWQLRLALREGDWDGALDATTTAEDDTTLRFWRGRALEALAQPEQAAATFRQVADERNLYGFLAAERSGRPKALQHRPTPVDLRLRLALEARPEFIHARELFKVGLDSRGRSAWARAIANLPPEALAQAALLAHEWGWHSRAIATAARAGLMDDLEIRYPLAWQDRFSETAAQARLPSPWTIGVARNESLFVPDIASPAGAIGVMQLMPATGREVARELRLPFQGLATLVDPDTNIRLGTRYLERMLARFDQHFVLATAAYNAGPTRVQRWLPEAPLPADAWIELIPFDETRAYVHRVMASKAIFHWRLTGEELTLAEIMRDVPAAGL